MEENKRWQKIIKGSFIFCIVTLVLFVVGMLILKYNVEGESNMPFNLSDILVVSTAEGYQENETNENWNVDVIQINDIYLDIKKNKNYKDKEIIKSIEISNIQIQNPTLGNIQIYRPSNSDQDYEYKEEYMINKSIEFKGDIKSDLKNLKISNQGGRILLRVINNTGKEYSSNEMEIKHDGSLLSKVGITNNEDIKFNLSFDIKISLESEVNYEGNIKIDLPKGDIINQGMTSIKENNLNKVVFKRK